MTRPGFIKHFERITKDYGPCMCLNLMNDTKKSSKMVTEQY